MNMQRNRHLVLITFILIIFLVYFGYCWLYKLEKLPGLHGDEAWFGLRAEEFSKFGVSKLSGMNLYTGALQSILSSWTFKLFGPGVFQLRLPGVILNFLSLMIIFFSFKHCNKSYVGIIFLGILSQSSLYFLAPRIAWEVTTCSLLFISLLVAAVTNILKNTETFKPFWTALILLTNLLGSYNHILFSNVSLAALLAVSLWSFYNKSLILQGLFFTLLVNLLNIVILHYTIEYWDDLSVTGSAATPLVIALLIIVLETMLLKGLFNRKIMGSITFYWPLPLFVIIGLLIVNFLFFHGMGMYQVISNHKILLEVLSYKVSGAVVISNLVCGAIICFYLGYFMLHDLKNKKESLFALFIISYLGLLSIYTHGSAFRYYLVGYIMVCLYLALKMSIRDKRLLPLEASISILLLLNIVSVIKIFHGADRAIKAETFVVGNQKIETSAHFLPKEPLIKFLKENKVSGIHYLNDEFFLRQPILFYKLVQGWEEDPASEAVVDYDYTNTKNGGFIFYNVR